MRENVRAFCSAAVTAFAPADPIVEFGSYRVPGQDVLADLRPLFPGAHYIGCDARPGPGVDRVEDICATSLPAASAGAVVCLDTLEHVFRVHDAIAEMQRVLRPDGVAIVATTMRFPIHHHPCDYWRLTPECLRRLAEPFPFRIIGSQGVESFPHTVFLVALKTAATDARSRADRLIADYTSWLENTRTRLPAGTRLRRALKRTYRSKGEREELAREFDARFDVHDDGDPSRRSG